MYCSVTVLQCTSGLFCQKNYSESPRVAWTGVLQCVTLQKTVCPLLVPQSGKDPDALSCRSFSANEPLIIWLLCKKWPLKMRYPTGLRVATMYWVVVYNICVRIASCDCTYWVHSEYPLIYPSRNVVHVCVCIGICTHSVFCITLFWECTYSTNHKGNHSEAPAADAIQVNIYLYIQVSLFIQCFTYHNVFKVYMRTSLKLTLILTQEM